MHPLDPGRVHENFVERARGGHTLERTAPELQRDEMFRQPIGVDLIEIGAKGGLHRVDEAAQDAILIEAFDLPQRGFDGCDDLSLACLALVRRLIGARIEARLEQTYDIGGDGRMLDQRRPHVVLGVGHADLPQEARNGADQGHVTPHHPCRQHERVVAVVLRAAAHHDQERRLETLLDGLEIDGASIRALEQHVVKPDIGLAFGIVLATRAI